VVIVLTAREALLVCTASEAVVGAGLALGGIVIGVFPLRAISIAKVVISQVGAGFAAHAEG
jgi:hypothetical protein